APPPVEAQPRRCKSEFIVSVSRRLTAMYGGRAARAESKCNGRKLTTRGTLRTAHRALPFVFLLSAFCLLPSEITPSLTVGLPPRTFSQNETTTPSSQPTLVPAPSPLPSPTPPPNLHQWGAVTLFHGLPSDRVHAVAQTEFGVTWFATDGGMAGYEGRLTSEINHEGLPH